VIGWLGTLRLRQFAHSQLAPSLHVTQLEFAITNHACTFVAPRILQRIHGPVSTAVRLATETIGFLHAGVVLVHSPLSI